MFLKLAVLNLRRHLKRTLLIIFAVAMSVMVMELVAGMFEGFRDGFFRNISDGGGHVVVNGSGWEDRLDPLSIDYRISYYPEVTEVLESIPGATEIGAVISFGALLLEGEDNVTVNGSGIDPGGSLYRNVRDGSAAGNVLEGDDEIIIGKGVADLMDLEPGSRVNLLVEDSTGSPFYLEYEVAGVFRTGSESYDASHIFISHRAAEELLYIPDETISIRVRLSDAELADQWKEEAVSALEENGRNPDDFLVRTWHDTQGSTASILEMMDVMMLFIDLLVVIVVASVITNAILMNVFERIGEFGTMRAMGLRRSGLLGMVLLEGSVQGVIGSILGLGVSVPVVRYLSVHGVDWGDMSKILGTGTSLWYFGYDPLNSLINMAAGTAIAVTGSLYAAVTAARMPILENLKQV